MMKKNIRQNKRIHVLLLSLSGALSLAAFQLLPSSLASRKLILMLVVVFLVSVFVFQFLFGILLKKISLPIRRKRFFLLLAFLLAIGVVFLFHLSLPEREILLPIRTVKISLSVDDKALALNQSIPAFESVHNGYHGVSLDQFVKVGNWQRVDQQLVLDDPAQENSLMWTGKAGQHLNVYFRHDAATSLVPVTIHINWGDGAKEERGLSDFNQERTWQISHDYGSAARAWEIFNFCFNLLSLIIPIAVLLYFYFLFFANGLQRRSRQFALLFCALSLFALGVRSFNAYQFSVGWDEGTTSRAAMRYADKALMAKWVEIPAMDYNLEHPALVKLLFSLPVIADGRVSYTRIGLPEYNRSDLAREDYTIFTSRFISVIFSLLTIQLLILLIHPLAGFFFIIHSLAAEYGAQARLEAVPMLFSFLSVWFFMGLLKQLKEKITPEIGEKAAWSAIFLGLTAASKVIYCVIVFAMIIASVETIIRSRQKFKPLFLILSGMAVLSVTTYFLFNPSLWVDPVGRLMGMVGFHEQYQTNAGPIYPWWQPFAWIFRSVVHQSDHFYVKNPLARAPQHFLFSADELIFLLALTGLPSIIRKQRIYLYWFLVSILFLIIWGTKWEQYACLVTIPLCVSAVYGTIRACNFFFSVQKEPM